jgi:DNA polymerase-1
MYLIDAHSLLFQVFHAIGEMTSPTGVPVNALFGFARDLLFLRAKKPDYLLCAFDRGEPTFRSEIYPDYKAHRGPMPDDLCVQVPLIRRLLEAMRVPELSAAGFEADDVIATVAKAASARGLDVFVCTSDKDCRQLIDDRVRLYSLRKKAEYGREELLRDWGISPEQVIDFQALVGDSVDNVPGVPGIGEKTAAVLLKEHGTLDNLLANLDRVSGAKRQENLRAWKGKEETTRQLVRLDTNVPLAMDWDGWKLGPMDEERLLALFREWGFRTLLPLVRADAPIAAEPAPVQAELFPFGANAGAETAPNSVLSTQHSAPGAHPADGWKATYHLVDTPKKFEGFLKKLRKQKRIAFDLETTSLNPLESEPVGLAFSWQAGEAYYLAVRGPAGAALLDPDATLARLGPVLEDPQVEKVNQNVKYDLLALRAAGVRVAGVAGDPMVAHYLLHAGQRSHNLEYLAQEYLRHQVIPITDLIGKKPRANEKGARQLRMDEVPTDRVAAYSGEDADVAWRLSELLEAQLSAAGLRPLYDELEVPLIEVLAELEHNGIRLDVGMLQGVGEEMAAQLSAIEQDIYRLAGREFNIASPKQLRQVLFDELKLPAQRRTGITGEASTDQETLEKLAALGHELPRKIVEHRQVAKLKGTYVDALPAMVSPRTGRVHASFNQTVTSTGRLSSSDPNLQNIPVRREQGRQIRRAFLPEEGWSLLTADYSQIELRLLAHFCGDDELRRAFAEGRDVHASVASQIFGVAEPDVTPEMRRRAKTVNFGVIYGISPVGLGQRLQMKRDDAAAFIDAYFARYPKVKEYQARLLEQARRTGYVTTILGRRREFDRGAIRADSTYQSRNQTEREAINMEIQGSAADLMKLAMLAVHRRLHAEGCRARMLLQIHDELVFEVPPEEFDAVAALVREEMTTPLERRLKLEVPLEVDLAAGPNWLDVEEVNHGRHEKHGKEERKEKKKTVKAAGTGGAAG